MPLVVYILGLTIFAIGTSELMIAGMMPSLAATFDISIGQVGHLISYFAFGVLLGGPILTYFFLKFKAPYRPTLLTLILLYAGIQGISAFMNNYEILIIIRVIIGVLCAGALSLSLATSMSLGLLSPPLLTNIGVGESVLHLLQSWFSAVLLPSFLCYQYLKMIKHRQQRMKWMLSKKPLIGKPA